MALQFRATDDGKVHSWRSGDSPPPEARWDICQNGCKTSKGTPQRLIAQKIEFLGKEGKTRRMYKCPQCGHVGRTILRKKQKASRQDLKEPDPKHK